VTRFLVKYNSNATSVTWGAAYGHLDTNWYYRVPPLALVDNGIIITYKYTPWVNLFEAGGTTVNRQSLLPTPSSNEDIAIIRYSNTGTVAWASSISGTSDTDIILSVTQTTDGTVVVSGRFVSPTLTARSPDLSITKSITKDANEEMFVFGFHPTTGVPLWGGRIGGSSAGNLLISNNRNLVSASSDGHLYIAGAMGNGSAYYINDTGVKFSTFPITTRVTETTTIPMESSFLVRIMQNGTAE